LPFVFDGCADVRHGRPHGALKTVELARLTLFRAFATKWNPAARTKVLSLTIRVVLALHSDASCWQLGYLVKTLTMNI
jgi:hypothetical protein